MKHILLFFLTLPLFVTAQECKVKKEIDKFNQQPKFSTGFLGLSSKSGKISLNIEADEKEIKFLFSLGKESCVSEESSAVFTFDNNRVKSTQRNTASMNCDGIFTLVFRNTQSTPSALQKLATLTTATIVITGSDGKKLEIIPTAEEKKLLQQYASCLLTEAKTLIKS